MLRREASYEGDVWGPRSSNGPIFVGAGPQAAPQARGGGGGGAGAGGAGGPTGVPGPGAAGAEGGNASRGEVVFALARGVATVVTLSALTLVMVLLIIAEAVLMVVAEKIGLAPVVCLVLTLMFVVGKQMGVPFQSLARVLVFLWAF